MLLPPPFLFLLLLFTSLISFSVSPIIHLNSDLRSLVHHRLPLAALSQLPKGHVKKEDFRVCLENWLVHLEKWNDDEFANVEGANKIAQDLELTGDSKKTSLQLSDPSDNTQPAPWAWGLSLALLQANKQLQYKQEPTLLMPWIFIPDGQAFHFTMMYEKASQETHLAGWVRFDPEDPVHSKVFQLLVPKPDIDVIREGMEVDLDAVYVRHNRCGNPERKSQVDDLTEYEKYSGFLFNIWHNLTNYPWLRKYVKFGKTALKQLVAEYEKDDRITMWFGNGFEKKLNEVKVWIENELSDVGE